MVLGRAQQASSGSIERRRVYVVQFSILVNRSRLSNSSAMERSAAVPVGQERRARRWRSSVAPSWRFIMAPNPRYFSAAALKVPFALAVAINVG
jgi:hypothetical protein